PWLRCHRHMGHDRLWHARLNVLHQHEKQAIRDVGGQAQALVYRLLFAVVIGVADHDVPRGNIDRCLHRLLERGPFLNDMIAPKSKTAALREYGGLLIERTVFEAKDEMTRYAIAFCDLC